MSKDKSNYEKGDRFGRWVLVGRLGSGGNGEVWRAENEKSKIAAIKLLRKNKLSIKAYQRFRDEVGAVIKNSDVGGILPVLDSCLPVDLSAQTPWYVMPVATPLEKYLRSKDVQHIVTSMISVARTLARLHERGVSHRDIKPSNLFHFKGAPCLGDFGLVDYPGKKDVTGSREAIGPRWTIAPEMRRRAATADGPPADSYSLAKTLWIFLTGQKTGFDGQYNSASDSNINIESYHRTIYAKPLNDLFYECTDNDPSKRPGLHDFADRLESWIRLNEEFRVRNPAQWRDLERELFPAGSPTRAIWDRRDDIVAVLKRIAVVGDLAHMFFPTGGGLHLVDVGESTEENCIELSGGGHPYIVKPRRLIFDSFGSDSKWNYFRLETHALSIVGDYDYDFDGKQEQLTEISPGLYTCYECYKFDDFDGDHLPESARTVVRVLEGDFVIFPVISPYNRDRTTYDARHNRVDADEFRKYIEDQLPRS
ncbi:MAG: serine/threonine protein kinase [Desulfomonilaceae bacterium]